MRLMGKKIGFAITGSFCTFAAVEPILDQLAQEGAEITLIMSKAAYQTDTKFGKAEDWLNRFSKYCSGPVINEIVTAEPIGPGKLLDLIVIAPCTGNTIAKLANGITDGPVLMATKAHLRNGRPVVIAVSTNDGLGMNAKNIGLLLNSKNIYLVPFCQDNPWQKPNSLVAKMELIPDTVIEALNGRQIQPVLLGPPK
ncbi:MULTISPECIES: dipicolinate synthase subunit B [unclassified Carboxydocella]|uniref:dipicolinate synthase subunit B n=1 Tax=unclassified Carboxydocella TaxID=2685367 RepID=UPI0009ACA6A3|nr:MULTISPECIES: dipicolinate synthase subunit B [unclassified Carboxydocella]GAW28234.1 dipicolinate synthase subunit B [Carboxydocella sp. ULO1]